MRYTWIALCLVFFGLAILAMSAVSAIEPQRATNDFSAEYDLQISERYIVWSKDGDIYGYDLKNNQQVDIVTSPMTEDNPDIQFDKVAYRRDWNELRYKNVSTGFDVVIMSGSVSGPAVYGDYIAFENYSWAGGLSEVTFQVFDTKTLSLNRVGFRQANNINYQYVDIYKNNVMYLFSENNHMYLYQDLAPNGGNPVLFQVPSSTGTCDYAGPNGDYAVCGGDGLYYKLDLKFGTVTPLSFTGGSFMGEGRIAVSGNNLLFLNLSEDANFNFDIYLYKLDTQQTTRLTYDPAFETSFALFGDRVAYTANRDGQYDVYFFMIPLNPPDLVLMDNFLTVKPAVGIIGNPVTLTTKVLNKGANPCDAILTVVSRDASGNWKKYQKNIAGLAPGTETSIVIDLPPPTSTGYMSIEAGVKQLVSANQQQELDLSNNKASLSIYITDKPVSSIKTSDISRGVWTFDVVSFDGTNSSDRDGITLYVWGFGDGTSSIGPKVDHYWTSPGVYNVTLRVYDLYGVMGETQVPVEIMNQLPVPVYSVPPEVVRNVPSVFSAAGSYDPDSRNVWIYWEFDAGSGTKGAFVEGAVVEYTFTTLNSSAKVVLHLVDENDGTDQSYEFDVKIVESTGKNIPPIAVIQMSGNGLNITFSGQGSFDPNGKIQTYSWSFSDGSKATGSVVVKNFTNPGTYIATLLVKDDENLDGTTTASVSLDYVTSPTIIQKINQTVINQVKGNQPPKGSASFTITTEKTGLVTFTGSGTDADGTIVKYEWDFNGDGTWDFSSTTTGDATNTYSKPGYYMALFRVTDNNGTSSVTAFSIAIRTNDIGTKTSALDSNAGLSTLLMALIISIVVAVAIAAVVGYVMSKKVATVKKDEAAEQEVAEIKKLVEESKATGANIDEAEALIRQFEGK